MDRARGGWLDTTVRLLTRRNSVYVAFILTGALVGERVVDYGINKLWESNNVGKSFEEIPSLGKKVAEEG
ncbi:unnamed protein product [Sphagnum jensenii]|uniref:Complex III subunit 9 n=2 Tax=Sphagnum jensenii TaxID=128206 RepID=A0ABP1A1L5_9BRYO